MAYFAEHQGKTIFSAECQIYNGSSEVNAKIAEIFAGY